MDECLSVSATECGCQWVWVSISVFTWQSLLFYCDLLAKRKERERDTINAKQQSAQQEQQQKISTWENLWAIAIAMWQRAGSWVAAVVALPHWDNERSLPNCCAAQECGMCGKAAKQEEAIDKCNSSSSQENENLLSENEGKPRVLVSTGSSRSSSSNNCSCNSNKAIELPLCCCCSLWLLSLSLSPVLSPLLSLTFPSLLWLFLCLPQRVAATIATASAAAAAAVALSSKLLSICGSIEQRSKQQL